MNPGIFPYSFEEIKINAFQISFEDVLIVDINCLIFILVYSGAILKIFNCIVYVMMHCFKKKDNFQEERDNGGAKQSGEEIK